MRRGQLIAAALRSTAGLPALAQRAAGDSDRGADAGAEYQKFEDFLEFLRERNARQYAAVGPSGIYEERYVPIGGIEQWVTIHGSDRANPVLLFLHGGPGDVTNPWTFVLFSSWQKHFTVVQWDQRGAGKTLRKSGPGIAPTITVDRMAQDGLDLARYLCDRLRKEKIAIVAHSFGTILGLRMVRRAPDPFYAYVGTGQVADGTQNYVVAYGKLLEHARAMGNEDAVAELTQAGPPPYSSSTGYGVQRKWSNAFEGADEFLPGTIGLRLVAPGGSIQGVNDEAAGEVLSADRLVPQTRNFRARDLGLAFPVPMFCIQGDDDFTTPTSLARGYFDSIAAPHKAFVTIPNAGHFAVFMHSDAFLQQLVRLVEPLARA